MCGTPESIKKLLESYKFELQVSKGYLKKDIEYVEERKAKIMSLEQSIEFLERKMNEYHS